MVSLVSGRQFLRVRDREAPGSKSRASVQFLNLEFAADDVGDWVIRLAKYGTLPNVDCAPAGIGSGHGFRIDSGGGSDEHHTDEDGGGDGRGGEVSDREFATSPGRPRDRGRYVSPRRHP